LSTIELISEWQEPANFWVRVIKREKRGSHGEQERVGIREGDPRARCNAQPEVDAPLRQEPSKPTRNLFGEAL
jgi:hypothetical protein